MKNINKLLYLYQIRYPFSHLKDMNSQTFDTKLCASFVQKQFEASVIPSLSDYIKIPNLSRSFDSQWNTNGLLEKAANHIKDWVDSLQISGLKSQIIKIPELSPIIYTEIEGDLNQTVFFYGHYDKQPPFTGWNQGLDPYIPVIKQGKLYGRGGADDGYSTYSTILAVKSLKQQGIPIPRCVMITQGDQESGSVHIQAYVKKLKERIGNPSIFFCLDSGTLDYQRIWLTNSLRGVVAATIRVDVLTQGIHSGDASGIVPSSFRIIRSLIDRIQNAQTGQIHQSFQVDIPPNRYKEMYDLVQTKKDQSIKQFPFLPGVNRVNENLLSSIIMRGWKAQMTVIGASGLPESKKAGNVMLPFNQVRISIRIPPTKNPKEAQRQLVKILTENPPYNAKITLTDVVSAGGFNAPQYSSLLSNSLNQASKIFYGKQNLNLSQGMSIPFLGYLKTLWPKGQFVVTGVLGPKSNAHGPNQFLDIQYCKKLTCSMAYVLWKISQNHNKK